MYHLKLSLAFSYNFFHDFDTVATYTGNPVYKSTTVKQPMRGDLLLLGILTGTDLGDVSVLTLSHLVASMLLI